MTMSDSIQFKRGPSTRLGQAALRTGEPAFCYDDKAFYIGVGEDQTPVRFINENEVRYLNTRAKQEMLEQMETALLNLEQLQTATSTLNEQLALTNTAYQHECNFLNTRLIQQYNALDYKLEDKTWELYQALEKRLEKQKIKSTDLSTACDQDKIGLAHLQQEVLAYFKQDQAIAEKPAVVNFNLLAPEVVEAIYDHDFGEFGASCELVLPEAATCGFSNVAQSIGFDALAPEIIQAIINHDFGAY